MLLGKGASVEVIDKDSGTPLRLALRSGYTGIIEMLLEQSAPVIKMAILRCTLLHEVVILIC